MFGPSWADWGGEGHAQATAAGSSRLWRNRKSRWRFSACGGDRWHYRQEPGGPFDRLPSRSPQPPRWQRGPPRMKPSTPSLVALLPQLRLPPVDGFPARTSTCARVGTGVVGVSVPQARAWLSLSLSQAPANPTRARPPVRTALAPAGGGQRRRAPRTCRARSASSCAPGHRRPAKSPARRRRQPQELRAPSWPRRKPAG